MGEKDETVTDPHVLGEGRSLSPLQEVLEKEKDYHILQRETEDGLWLMKIEKT